MLTSPNDTKMEEIIAPSAQAAARRDEVSRLVADSWFLSETAGCV